MQMIGTLEALRRYPVKSMSGEELERVHVAFTGVSGDRIYAFLSSKKLTERPNFPWFSAREQRDLLLYQPRFVKDLPLDVQYPSADAFVIEVTTPGGRVLKIDDPELQRELEAKATYPISLRFSEKGMQDARPLSIFGLQTLKALGGEVGRDLDGRRFRANFYIRWQDDTPFYEDSLVGRRLMIGDRLEITVVKKDPRCVIVNLDPDTAEPHPEVLQTVAKSHRGCVGVYAAVLREGPVARGDKVQLLDAP